jgi:hypothetical protein
MIQLTKTQKSIIKHLGHLKLLSIFFALFGILGFLLGLYSFFYRPMTLDARPLNLSLLLFSIGIFTLACLLRQAYDIIERFSQVHQIQ